MILRTIEWEGAPPAEGDVVLIDGDEVAVILSVAMGAGLGQWTLDVSPRRLVRWSPLPTIDP